MDIDSKISPLFLGSPKIAGILSLKSEALNLKTRRKRGRQILGLIMAISVVGVFPFFSVKAPVAEADLLIEEPLTLSEEFPEIGLLVFQGNTLTAPSSPFIVEPEPEPILSSQPSQRILATITAYSSTPWETWGNPYVTASGSGVGEGVIANNVLPFGTKLRIPAIYGDKVFVVEDRMNSRWSSDRFDIWFPSSQEARAFGIKRVYIEILE